MYISFHAANILSFVSRKISAGGQGEQSSLRLFGKSTPRELFEDGANSGILVVAPRSFAARVGLKDRLLPL